MKTMKTTKNLFIDILPSYKINEDNKGGKSQQGNFGKESKDTNKSQSFSKEVETLHSYEKNLLKYYERFLNVLSIFLKTFSSSKKSASRPGIAKFLQFTIETIAALFDKFFNFNYSDILYKLLIEKLTDDNPVIRQKCFECLTNVLSVRDNSGPIFDLKYEMIKLICHFIFIKPHQKFDQNVLDLFTCHKIEFPDLQKDRDEMSKLADIKHGKRDKIKMDNDHMTKKQEQIEKKEKKLLMREKEKIIKNLKREMNEYDNYSSAKMIFNMNLKILKKVLYVYFDILKFKKSSPLVRSVLNGIGVLCENINIEILIDLQKCVYEFISYSLSEDPKPENKVYSVSALKSCLSITEKLTKEIISIEDSNLINTTYLFICKIADEKYLTHMTKDDLFTLFEILDTIFLKNRQYSLDTVSAYVKRIAIMTTRLDEKFVPAFLLFMKRIVQKYPGIGTIRDNDDDFFDYFILSDPSICNGKQSNIYKEVKSISTKFAHSKMIKKLVDYLNKDERINPQFATLNYFELLLSA